MALYILIHGASTDSWYWHRVVPLLEARGHAVVAPDLPIDSDAAGIDAYTNAVLEAVGDLARGQMQIIVVGQSMGGFTAPLVCARLPASLLVLVAAMIPLPRERLGDWWSHTGWEQARAEELARQGRPGGGFDVMADFFHDVPRNVVAEAMARGERYQSRRPFEEVWPLDAWPAVPTTFLLCTKDRFFPPAFLRRIVEDRLGIVPDEMDSGHLPALGHPEELANRLEMYREEAPGRPA